MNQIVKMWVIRFCCLLHWWIIVSPQRKTARSLCSGPTCSTFPELALYLIEVLTNSTQFVLRSFNNGTLGRNSYAICKVLEHKLIIILLNGIFRENQFGSKNEYFPNEWIQRLLKTDKDIDFFRSFKEQQRRGWHWRHEEFTLIVYSFYSINSTRSKLFLERLLAEFHLIEINLTVTPIEATKQNIVVNFTTKTWIKYVQYASHAWENECMKRMRKTWRRWRRRWRKEEKYRGEKNDSGLT